MNQEKKARFLNAINTNASVYGKTLTDEVVAVYWAVLKDFPVDEISMAFFKHLKLSKFFPTPAELLELLPSASANKAIGADEAWGLVLDSFDESKTVVITKEIAEARGIAMPVYQSGDEVGARVAFRDAYNRLIRNAGAPEWFVSAGFDIQGRHNAVVRAIEHGQLSLNDVTRRYMIKAPTVTVAGLLESSVEKAKPADKANALNAVKRLRGLLGGEIDREPTKREIDQAEFERKKAEQLARVKEAMNGQPA